MAMGFARAWIVASGDSARPCIFGVLKVGAVVDGKFHIPGSVLVLAPGLDSQGFDMGILK